eukprot:3509553-Prymnesium_polylepis.1
MGSFRVLPGRRVSLESVYEHPQHTLSTLPTVRSTYRSQMGCPKRLVYWITTVPPPHCRVCGAETRQPSCLLSCQSAHDTGVRYSPYHLQQ